VIIATQEPTVIPSTILDLASMIICHRFSSPAWCTHLARHVSASSESADWYQQVTLLATGDALVFSPAAVIAADDRGGVVLLGREHLKLRVRPRLTLDGGASLLAVGRRSPALAGGSAASPLLFSLPTPPASQSDLPAHREARVEVTGTAPPLPAPTPIVAGAMPFMPLGAPPTSTTGSPVGVPAPSVPSVVKSPALAPRTVPARFKHLVGWLSSNGAGYGPLKLSDAQAALSGVGKQQYASTDKSWWMQMIPEAVKEGLIELTDTKLKGKEEKMIRLLQRGQLVYV
jgi:hypothetical protein